MDLAWYVRRLRAMSPTEVADRVRHARLRRAWRGSQVGIGAIDPLPVPPGPHPVSLGLGAGALAAVPSAARSRVVAEAEEILAGRWSYFGSARHDLVDPDWWVDPVTGRRAPDRYAFEVPYRDESAVGNIKRIWEPSRHHHLTVLATAYALTGDARFAERSAAHLRSWMVANPFLTGVHWTSGIELGIRLISWVWTRRLLDGWSGAPALFEGNDDFMRQVHHHLTWLEVFHSTGSSANNHVIAEAAGMVVAANGFAWFEESARWQELGSGLLARELEQNTFPSGLNRELATEYHGLVLELALAAALEADAARRPLGEPVWRTITAMLDALATVVDVHGEPPRQGDADDGQVLVLDAAGTNRWASLLHTGSRLVGAPEWWPALPIGDVRTPLWTSLAADRPPSLVGRPVRRPAFLADAGMTILRTRATDGPEIWCRCDAGPHGFLSIAAHGHADALSIELRVDGVDVLADPGTYCYHGEAKWRSYFRGTAAHNTVEVAGRDQSESAGPFLWGRQARSVLRAIEVDPSAETVSWSAEHHGYEVLDPPVVHRRTVELQRLERRLVVVDEVDGGGHAARLAWHLGPEVDVTLNGHTATLQWPGGAARMVLPAELDWTAVRGQDDPVRGWYSPGFDRKVPSWTLVGDGWSGSRWLTTIHL